MTTQARDTPGGPRSSAVSVGDRLALAAIRALSIAAACVAAYLLFVSLGQRGLPLGCGQGSGCDEVLRSRWSSLFGVPISGFALVAYFAAFLASFAVNTKRDRAAWNMLYAISVSVLASAIWFVGLQFVVLRAVCPWCMADHLLGVSMAGVILWAGQRAIARGGSGGNAARRLRWPALAGLVLAGALIGLQIPFGGSGAPLARLPSGQNADTGPGADRQIAVLDGQLALDVHELPVVGSPDAPKLIVLLFDYCCPHCRATHGYLLDGMRNYPGQYGVVLLPMPLDKQCNPSVDETEPRFRESCDLARVALAIWRAKPSAFLDFDAWLYEPDVPRTLAQAQARAVQMVGQSPLDGALADPWIEQRIAADVAAYSSSGVETIPILLSPGMDSVVGRPGSAEELFAILEQELGLRPSPP
jgi:uncharacterized membrane protein/protein-disulfide isomerase